MRVLNFASGNSIAAIGHGCGIATYKRRKHWRGKLYVIFIAAAIIAAPLACSPARAADIEIFSTTPAHTDTATDTTSSAVPFDARAGIVIRDALAGGFLVWLDRGLTDGVSPGSAFDISVRGIPAGTLWIDEAMQFTSAGRLIAIKGCPKLISGETLTLILAETTRTLNMPLIALPSSGHEISAAPSMSAKTSEKSLLGNFLEWTHMRPGKSAPEIFPSPGSPISSLVAPAAGSSFKPPVEKIEPEPQAEKAEIDYDIKSSYFVSEGDCLNVSPWPGTDKGRNIIIKNDLDIEYPGGGKIPIKGKTIAALEKDFEAFLQRRGIKTKSEISPCRLRSE